MGIQSSMPKSDGLFGMKSTTQTTDQLIDHLFPDEDAENNSETHINTEQKRTSTPIDNKPTIATVSEVSYPDELEHIEERTKIPFAHPFINITYFQSTLSESSEYKTAEGSVQDSLAATSSSMNSTMFKSTLDDDSLYKLYENSANEPDPVSDTEENETIYLITIDGPHKNDLILIVSDQSIREKDALTTRTITRWNMTMLESCERVKTDVLRLRFDTVKRDKKERIYHLEEGHGQVGRFFFLKERARN